MLPLTIVPEIEKLLKNHCQQEALIDETIAVGGGSINAAYRLSYAGKSFFLKYNDASRFPQMFEKEALGLKLLTESKSLRIPQIIGHGGNGQTSFLLLEFIAQGQPDKQFWEDFGHGLASLHRNTHTTFGLDHSNYIGSLKQDNTVETSWVDFFIRQRLQPQLKLAKQQALLSTTILSDFEKLFKLLPSLFPEEAPALLHGDLWSGNFLCSATGEAVLIDPAVYYGHREMDIGMSKLFGGFYPHFYDTYNEVWPMEKGWQQRVDLCNLYPLLVHVNLFGGAYARQLEGSLGKYVS
jgi:fructosamine-3-kinase